MAITQQGALNTTALIVPDLYIQIVPPQNLVLNGVPTNVLGVVGTASWGPPNIATIIGTMADYARAFGAVQNRKYDMATQVATAVQQGASNFRCVRVTDGTDVAASLALTGAATQTPQTLTFAGAITAGDQKTASWTIGALAVLSSVTVAAADTLITIAARSAAYVNAQAAANGAAVTLGIYAVSDGISKVTIYANAGVTFGSIAAGGSAATLTQTAATGATTTAAATVTAQYTGTSGNSVALVVTAAGAAAAWNVRINPPTGGAPEFFTNIPTVGFWTYLANAINGGQSALRGPSQYVTMSTPNLGAGPLAVGTYTLVGGTDGVPGVAGSSLVGVDTATRTGMFSLRGQGCSVALLADMDDSTQWSTVNAFGLSEGIYMIQTGPAGQTIASATAAKSAAALDSYASKLMMGDWVYWFDQTAGITRLVSPQGFIAGRLANLSPEQSSLNKPLYSVVGTQKTGLVSAGTLQTYSQAELQSMIVVGIDVITNPGGGGLPMWTARSGHNSSTNPAVNGDNYTRLTNYIASTLAAGMGRYIGQLINPGLFQRIRGTLLSFLANMLGQGQLGLITNADNTVSIPYSVTCDGTNNPTSRTALGYVQADVQVQYQAINEKFIVNLEGGQTVQVQRQTTPNRA